MNMIKTYDDFISEAFKTSESNGKTWQDAIDRIRPGDNIVITFPEGFELERYDFEEGKKVLKKFDCTKLNVYHWDEDDHWCVDFYFYEPKETFKGSIYNWTCKMHDLSDGSKEKVKEYLKNTSADEM
jgi:hypothetical protein